MFISVSNYGQNVTNNVFFCGDSREITMHQVFIKDLKLKEIINYMMWSKGNNSAEFNNIPTSHILEFYKNDDLEAYFLSISEFDFAKYPDELIQYYTIVDNKLYIVLNPPQWVFNIDPVNIKILVKERDYYSDSSFEYILYSYKESNGKIGYSVVSLWTTK